MRYLFVALTLIIVWAGNQNAEAGTFYNPEGDPKVVKEGREASAILNEGLALMYQMLAAMERGQFGKAADIRASAEKSFLAAVNRFRIVEKIAVKDTRFLSFKPRNAQDEIYLKRLEHELKSLKLPFPKTAKGLASISIVMIEQFATRIKEVRPGALFEKPDDLHVFLREGLRLQTLGIAVSRAWIMSK